MVQFDSFLGDVLNHKHALTDITGLTNPILFKGSISTSSDFPTLSDVQNGWFYRVLATVTDNDGSKTNTGQSFIDGDEIVWNGTNWTLLGNLSGYVPYTGATSNVNLGTYSLIAHAIQSDASDGLIIKAANGTDVGIFGVGNSNNATLYGNLQVNGLTAGRAVFTGTSGLLSTDGNFLWDTLTRTLTLGVASSTNAIFKMEGASVAGRTPSIFIDATKLNTSFGGSNTITSPGLAFIAGSNATVSGTAGINIGSGTLSRTATVSATSGINIGTANTNAGTSSIIIANYGDTSTANTITIGIGSSAQLFQNSITNSILMGFGDTSQQNLLHLEKSKGARVGATSGETQTMSGDDLYVLGHIETDGGIYDDSGTTFGIIYLNSSKKHTTGVNLQYNSTTNIVENYATLGSEKVTNGTFTGSATGWTLTTGWAYSSNTVQHNANGTTTLSQSLSIAANEWYELTFTISGWTVGTVTPSCGGVTLTARGADGTYAERFFTTSNASLVFTPTNTARFTLDTVSVKQLTNGGLYTGGTVISKELNITQSASNFNQGTTRHVRLSNPSGSYTHIEGVFGSNYRAGLSWNSSGTWYQQSNNGTYYWYYGNPSSPSSYHSYNTTSGFNHIAAGAFGSNLSVGQQTFSPPSTFTNYASTGLKTKFAKVTQTLDGTYTEIYARPDLASVCSGTITYACSHWTNQTDCELRDSHGGCTWNAITCSDYSYTDEATCEANSGCTFSEASCSGAGDQYTCEAQDDSYGGSCSWNNNSQSCSVYNGDEMTCTSTTGCSWDSADCSAFNGDQTTCEATTGCSWSDPDCSGTYYPGTCSGSYDSYSCDGNYFTGECSGSGGTCTGTSSCGGIDDSSSCGGEAGCSWVTGMTLTFPPDTGTAFYRRYWIKNGSAATSLTISPNTNQTVNSTTSDTIAAGKAKEYTFFYFTEPCSQWNNTSSGTCTTGHTGCSWVTCSSYHGNQSGCEATSVCSWNSETNECDGGDQCSGTWTVLRDWSITAQF